MPLTICLATCAKKYNGGRGKHASKESIWSILWLHTKPSLLLCMSMQTILDKKKKHQGYIDMYSTKSAREHTSWHKMESFCILVKLKEPKYLDAGWVLQGGWVGLQKRLSTMTFFMVKTAMIGFHMIHQKHWTLLNRSTINAEMAWLVLQAQCLGVQWLSAHHHSQSHVA